MKIDKKFEEKILRVLKGQHFMNYVGFKIVELSEGLVIIKLVVEEKHKQQSGFVHGGVTATIGDLVMGFAALTKVEDSKGVVTADLNISFLNPGIGDALIAEGRVIKSGKKLHFCEADIYTLSKDKKVHIAKARSIMTVIDLAM